MKNLMRKYNKRRRLQQRCRYFGCGPCRVRCCSCWSSFFQCLWLPGRRGLLAGGSSHTLVAPMPQTSTCTASSPPASTYSRSTCSRLPCGCCCQRRPGSHAERRSSRALALFSHPHLPWDDGEATFKALKQLVTTMVTTSVPDASGKDVDAGAGKSSANGATSANNNLYKHQLHLQGSRNGSRLPMERKGPYTCMHVQNCFPRGMFCRWYVLQLTIRMATPLAAGTLTGHHGSGLRLLAERYPSAAQYRHNGRRSVVGRKGSRMSDDNVRWHSFGMLLTKWVAHRDFCWLVLCPQNTREMVMALQDYQGTMSLRMATLEEALKDLKHIITGKHGSGSQNSHSHYGRRGSAASALVAGSMFPSSHSMESQAVKDRRHHHRHRRRKSSSGRRRKSSNARRPRGQTPFFEDSDHTDSAGGGRRSRGISPV